MAEEVKNEGTQEPQVKPRTTKTGEPDKRQKNPNEPTVLPFQLITPATRERLASIGKSNEATLTMLLDAYEQMQNAGANNESELQSTIDTLKEEGTRLRTDLKAAQEANTAAAVKQQELEQEIAALKAAVPKKDTALEQQITELKQQLSEADSRYEKMKADMLNMNHTTSQDAATIKALQEELKDYKNNAGAISDKSKEDTKVIEGLSNAKKECEKERDKLKSELALTKQELEELRNSYLELETNLAQPATNQYPEGDILHFFPTITAKFLEATSNKLTACRHDGKVVTPAMILGDMFNRYTIERFNLWFYKWVLEDNELIKIAQEVEPKINSKRMLRAALGIK